MVKIEQVKFDSIAPNNQNSGVLATATPSLSWSFEGDEKNWLQQSYHLKITYGNGDVEEFSKDSNISTHIEWPGRALVSKELVKLSIRVVGQDSSASDWSDFKLQVGILNNEWSTKFIALKDQPIATHSKKISPEILFRSPVFNVKKQVKSAKVYSTALGVYELEINGSKVGDNYLEPGWTSYEHRLLHQVYDITSQILSGLENVIAGRVAAGWFSGFLGFDGGASNIYGDRKGLSLELDIEYEDGSHDSIKTDESWNATYGPITNAQLYTGETYDANKEIENWSSSKLSDLSSWEPVEVIDNPAKRIIPQYFGFSHVVDTFKPIEVITSPSGKTILDIGQNAVGFIHMFPVKASEGHTITFKHAEVLEKEELGTRPLRGAAATDVYIFKGDPSGEEYIPRFTFHGGRYIQIENYPGEVTKDSFEFLAISTEMEQIGFFKTSDPLLNRLHDNVFHSTRGNFISLPMDCPQRDERMGWLGDIAVFAPTSLYLFDSYAFLKSWLEDLKYEQEANGGFPAVVVPDVIKAYDTPWNGCYAAIWQDASVIVPWRLYEATKNSDVLVDQYDSMKTWFEFIPKIEGKIRWDKVKFQLGDWLDPTAPPDNPFLATTDAYLVADAFLYLILTQLVETAKVLGYESDAEYFSSKRNQSKQDFRDAYLKDGDLINKSQTGYALVISFGLIDDEEKVLKAGESLSKLVESNNFRIGTGFAGTPFITEALVLAKQPDTAYKMLKTQECPSWLYPVSIGATTVWERWDSMLPDGSINPGNMTSFNHYALGAVAIWMDERIGGLKSLKPGYEEFSLKPILGGNLAFAETRHKSPYGWIESSWKIEDGKFNYHVKVPHNSKAFVELPNGEKYEVGSGDYYYSVGL